MAGPITVDTPDYQRGIVNAQTLLAVAGAHIPFETVGIPPNAESLIVTNLVWSVHATVQVRGATTGLLYPGVLLQPGPAGINTATWVFDIAACLDTEVEVSVSPTPAFSWFVYADGGVHLTSDASALRSGLGQGYVIPSAPSTFANDHPPVELQFAQAGNFASGTVVIAAPGSGARLRLFYANVSNLTANSYVNLSGSASGKIVLAGVAGPAGTITPVDYKPSGVVLGDNDALLLVTGGGNGTTNVVYTVEFI